uniref:uncharacterized protein LOC120337865 n=1 Tax=Styela clava TaxID=7725 RepID=UPI0019393D5B|nr:uncharacterized protein LOC120337865 [Styela clava]
MMRRLTLLIICGCFIPLGKCENIVGTDDELPCVGDDCVTDYVPSFEEIDFGDLEVDFQDTGDVLFPDLNDFSDDLGDLSNTDLNDLPAVLGDLDDIETAEHAGEMGTNIDNFFDQLNARMCELDSKLEEIKNSFSSSLETLRSVTHDGKCDVEYSGKCFHVVWKESKDITQANARTICGNIGWDLANIYTEEHYIKIAEYLRLQMFLNQMNGDVWLGMKFDPKTNEVRSESNAPIDFSEVTWHPSFPSSESNEESMALRIARNNEEDQGIINVQAGSHLSGALCEL